MDDELRLGRGLQATTYVAGDESDHLAVHEVRRPLEKALRVTSQNVDLRAPTRAHVVPTQRLEQPGADEAGTTGDEDACALKFAQVVFRQHHDLGQVPRREEDVGCS